MKNEKSLFGILFSGVYFAFCSTAEEAAQTAANAGYCPHTGLNAIVDEFRPGELELLENVWWYKKEQIVHRDNVPWLS